MTDLFAANDTQATVDHRCLGCGQVHAGARDVTLVDGSVVSSYSAAWLLECEARTTLNIPRLMGRQARLADVERRRGKKAADDLRAVMLALWTAAQKNAAA